MSIAKMIRITSHNLNKKEILNLFSVKKLIVPSTKIKYLKKKKFLQKELEKFSEKIKFIIKEKYNISSGYNNLFLKNFFLLKIKS